VRMIRANDLQARCFHGKKRIHAEKVHRRL
jgi:hypothetical protein